MTVSDGRADSTATPRSFHRERKIDLSEDRNTGLLKIDFLLVTGFVESNGTGWRRLDALKNPKQVNLIRSARCVYRRAS